MIELELKFDWMFEYLKRVTSILYYYLYWTQNIIGCRNLIYAVSISVYIAIFLLSGINIKLIFKTFDNLCPIALLLLTGLRLKKRNLVKKCQGN